MFPKASERQPMSWANFAAWQGLALAAALVLLPVVGEFTQTKTAAFIFDVRDWLQPQPVVVSTDDGIPQVDYRSHGGGDIGTQISPVQVAEQLIGSAALAKKGDAEALVRTKRLGDWLLAHLERRGDFSVFVYSFAWPKYELKAPWVSALAQGFALEGLIGAFQVTQEAKYLDAAKLVLQSFFVDVEAGGVTYKDSDGWWYEEYAKPGAVKSRVLNGMMYVLVSLHTYWQATGDVQAKLLFDNGIRSLVKHLPDYDFGGFSHYDALGSTAGYYHQIHITLLDKLHAFTGLAVFAKYRDRWTSYESRSFLSKLVYSPQKIILAVAFLNFVLLWFVAEIAIGSLLWRRLRRMAKEAAAKESAAEPAPLV